MAIEKLDEFAKDGQKNTDGLTLTDGFPVLVKPARQWFNYLFNAIAVKINQIIDAKIDYDSIVDNLTTNDATKPISAKQGKALQDNKLGKSENAVSATKLVTSRNINGIEFDGSADITITADLPYIGTVTNQTALDNATTAGRYLVSDLSIAGLYSYGVLHVYRVGNTIHQTYYAHQRNTLGSVAVRQSWGSFNAWRCLDPDNVASATKLETARTIGGVSFDGTSNINLPGVNATGNQSTTGNAATATTALSCSGNSATATKLATARTIGGVSFDGSANINLPGVNTQGNQNTTGNAATATTASSCSGNSATATKLATARTISLTGAAQALASFDGSGNIAIATEGLGVGQTWQNLTASRSLATTYTNSTGKPIMVSVTWEQSNQGEMTLTVGGIAVDRGRQNQVGGGAAVQAIVPTGATYSVTSSANTIVNWLELR